ncbi:hypothetical protein J32TS2_05220 [Shouchella clausii]|nr:hypothetical protein J1TS1_04990 [Shouchella clausii]GIN15166.1 hypothetical protein J32TS2_05220 [Shouchella clausii]
MMGLIVGAFAKKRSRWIKAAIQDAEMKREKSENNWKSEKSEDERQLAGIKDNFSLRRTLLALVRPFLT